MELPEEQKAEGPAELIFVHAGHTAKVNDISWNPNVGDEGASEGQEEWTLASVGGDTVLQIWQPAQAVYDRSIGDGVDINNM